jgi:FtsX-like permease family/MacB-like periplasmic core domain
MPEWKPEIRRRLAPNFFTTLGIPIVSGRALNESDPPCGRSGCSVVVSEDLARQFWPGASPLGKELRDTRGTRFEVVVVARNISTQQLGGLDDPMVYLPWIPNVCPNCYAPPKELGIRIALGARKRDIYGTVFGASARPVIAGLLIGFLLTLAGTTALARVLQRARFTVNVYDPITYTIAAVLLVAVALAAMLGPARRAMHVDPMLVLRDE